MRPLPNNLRFWVRLAIKFYLRPILLPWGGLVSSVGNGSKSRRLSFFKRVMDREKRIEVAGNQKQAGASGRPIGRSTVVHTICTLGSVNWLTLWDLTGSGDVSVGRLTYSLMFNREWDSLRQSTGRSTSVSVLAADGEPTCSVCCLSLLYINRDVCSLFCNLEKCEKHIPLINSLINQ